MAPAVPAAGPSRPTPTPLFEMSSQFKHWRFSRTGLVRARQELNEGAIERVRAKLEEDRSAASSLPKAQEAEKGDVEMLPTPTNIEYLSVADELSLVAFYLSKIAAFSRSAQFSFPEAVEATATTYLKRFYIRNTCMDYHPKNVMLTCLFLAAKTENYMMPIAQFVGRLPKVEEKDVLGLEFLVAQSLRFEFKVHHAHVAARGILVDLANSPRSVLPSPLNDPPEAPVGPEPLRAPWERVVALLRVARQTDAEFLYAPSQIALACWFLASPDFATAWLNTIYSRATTSSDSTPPQVPDLEPLKSLILAAEASPGWSKESVTLVDRRLRLCRNPEKDPSSALYKKLKEEEESKQLEKNEKRAEGRRKKEAEEDPFGMPMEH